MLLLNIILLVFLGILLLRTLATRQTLRALIVAARENRPLLTDRRGGPFNSASATKLVAAYNDLIREKDDISNTRQKQLAQISATLSNIREAVVIVDEEKKIRLANKAFLKLFGETGEVEGKRLDLFLSGPGFREFLTRCDNAEKGCQATLDTAVGGRRCSLEIRMARLPVDLYPKFRYSLFFLNDITRQKGLERMRTDFVANVSHELRTPVTVIRGFAETLMEDHAELPVSEQIRFLEKILSHSIRLDNLLRDLLLLSRLESAETDLKKEILSLSGFLTGQTEFWESLPGESGKKLEQDYEGGDDRIRADPLRLTQVVTNLLQNSVLHAKGSSWIRLVSKVEENGVVLMVEDNGAGIPEKDLPHIFQRFYRVEKGRSRDSGGTGLGLSIVKHIVVQHGAAIVARNREGGGTIIEIRFPRLEGD